MLENYEIAKAIEDFNKRLDELKVAINIEKVKEELKVNEEKMNDSNFWLNAENSKLVLKEVKSAKDKIDTINNLSSKIEELVFYFDMHKAEEDDLSTEIENIINEISTDLSDFEIRMLLSKEYDDSDAIIDMHPGAGGTESQDWGEMLFRMYKRYAESHEYEFEVLDYLDGEEAGIKSVTVLISGKNAYGLLKGERGVHRLVRISPFDANKRRHTSFASVDVSPVREDVKDVVVNDQDIRIDTYLSSGHGGQGVNTTYSAVRITHYPSGIVVTCQNERSQLQNKEQAMNILKSKLLEIEIKKQEEELMNLKGSNSQIAFGSQIRSYVFHPYSMVKDHRFDVETGNATAVMDGDIDAFIYGYLKWMVSQNA